MERITQATTALRADAQSIPRPQFEHVDLADVELAILAGIASRRRQAAQAPGGWKMYRSMAREVTTV